MHRFPSLEEFDESGPQSTPAFETESSIDFLSREKALLGEDANQFSSGGDSAAFLSDDLLGGDLGPLEPSESIAGVESSFPAIDLPKENLLSSTTITGQQSSYEPPSSFPEEEPEVIRKWRERRDQALQERAARSEEQKQETIKSAQKSIDEFYENYNTKKEKNIAETRREAEEFLTSREDTSAGGTSWERIAKLVDISGKGVKGGASGTDKARFRDLLISLKKDKNAPGASGY